MNRTHITNAYCLSNSQKGTSNDHHYCRSDTTKRKGEKKGRRGKTFSKLRCKLRIGPAQVMFWGIDGWNFEMEMFRGQTSRRKETECALYILVLQDVFDEHNAICCRKQLRLEFSLARIEERWNNSGCTWEESYSPRHIKLYGKIPELISQSKQYWEIIFPGQITTGRIPSPISCIKQIIFVVILLSPLTTASARSAFLRQSESETIRSLPFPCEIRTRKPLTIFNKEKGR